MDFISRSGRTGIHRRMRRPCRTTHYGANQRPGHGRSHTNRCAHSQRSRDRHAPATPTAAPVASATAAPAAGLDFVPAARSVWNTAVGLDNMSGTCAKGSLLPVYGLVQITPDGDRLNWKNQEPAPYVFGKLQTNLYQYAGPSAIKDGVVTMTVTFLSEKDLEMKREFVANADPACLHTHVYTGTFQWAK